MRAVGRSYGQPHRFDRLGEFRYRPRSRRRDLRSSRAGLAWPEVDTMVGA